MNKKAITSSKSTEKEKSSEEVSHSWCPFDFMFVSWYLIVFKIFIEVVEVN